MGTRGENTQKRFDKGCNEEKRVLREREGDKTVQRVKDDHK